MWVRECGRDSGHDQHRPIKKLPHGTSIFREILSSGKISKNVELGHSDEHG